MGMFCHDQLSQNEWITEYAGEVLHIDSNFFRVRRLAYSRILHSYTFQMPLGHDLVIDSIQYGNYGRCMNHSHAPNCEALSVLVDREPRLFIRAIEEIPPHTELTINYSTKLDYHDL